MENNKMKEKYGLFTAISMVVGIVIGSGIFFKASKVLSNTDGSMLKTIAVVGIVGIIMLICSLIFASLATRYEKVNGIVDYAEVMVGPKYAYVIAWFMTTIYYPSLTACLAWVSAQYTCALFGFDVAGSTHVAIGAAYLIGIYALNALSPKLAGKFQVSTTVIKLIPLVLMAIVGTVVGVIRGTTVEAFAATTQQIADSSGSGMLGAIVAFAFAYEGWIIATSINAELKDAKKNLPMALVIGALIVIAVYICYFIGLTGSMSVAEMTAAEDLPRQAFSSVFGSFVGSIIYVLIVISCLGTTNGLMMGSIRGAYSIAARRRGMRPHSLSELDPHSNAPTNSSTIGLIMCGIWFFYWQVCFFEGRILGSINLPAFLTWEPDELPIIALYGSYIPIFISMMIKEKEMNVFKRFVMPVLGVIASGFMVFSAIKAYGVDCLYWLAMFAIVTVIGLFFMKPKAPKEAIKE